MGRREQLQIMRSYSDAAGRLRTATLTAAGAAFAGLDSWRDADMRAFGRQFVPRIAGAQQQMQMTTVAYLRELLADLLGVPRSSASFAPRSGQDLRGVPPATVYERPFRQIWADLGAGADWEDAYTHGLTRLQWIVATDLQLAKTHSSRDALAETDEAQVRFYRRVLTGTSSCGLCVVASTQRYHKGDLLPIHPGCDCAVAPIAGDTDPGQVVNEPLLEDVHDAIRQTFGTADRGGRALDYRDIVVTHEHGEIGPVLARRADHFTGPGDLGGGSAT